MFSKKTFRLSVKTGDQIYAGTDANVYVALEDEEGRKTSDYKLDKIMYNDLERGCVDEHQISAPKEFGGVTKLHMHRDSKGLGDSWFCDYFIIEDLRLSNNNNNSSSPTKKEKYYFPIHRWISHEHHYEFWEYGTCLPQADPCPVARTSNLKEKQESYKYIFRLGKEPKDTIVAQVENLPGDEKFSDEYYWGFATGKAKLLAETKWMEWTNKTKWKSLSDLKSVYKNSLGEPECINVWREDWWFALQRLQGVNPQIIEICTQIPDNLDVTDTTVDGLLDNLMLHEALQNKKIFICNLQILDGVICKNNRELAAPMALFYLNKENILLPIAIQLKQKKGDDNPVFTPKDSANTWLIAKMFYNNAEAQHHQALSHLGYTHLLMEGIVVCTHRNLSPSHPLFKLMAPHFLFLLAINTRGLEKLVSAGGWIDNCMTQGLDGILDLMKRGFDHWTYTRYGSVAKEVGSRGVLDKDILPYYPYRDDALPLFDIIKKYVQTVVEHHYDSEEKLKEDWELKSWREELVKPRNKNGVGIEDIPGSETGFNSVEEIVDVVTMIVSTCSLGHAASNFQQYEQYGYVPNYPGILMSNLPKEKKEYTEQDIMQMLPDKRMTLDIMVITKLLSTKGTKSLGDFEMQYLYDPVGIEAAQEFRKNVDRLSKEIKLRNVDRKWKFDWLDPINVPNSISV